MISCVQLFVTPWTAAHQAPQSMGFSRQENWSRLPCPPPGDPPDPGIEPTCLVSPALAGGFFTTGAPLGAPDCPADSYGIGVPPRAQVCAASRGPKGLLCSIWLTCFLQGLEAPGHARDAGVEAAATIVALLGRDLGVAAVHPVLGWHRALVRRWPTQSRSESPLWLGLGPPAALTSPLPPPSAQFLGYNPSPPPTPVAPGPSFHINISGEMFCERSGRLPSVSLTWVLLAPVEPGFPPVGWYPQESRVP